MSNVYLTWSSEIGIVHHISNTLHRRLAEIRGGDDTMANHPSRSRHGDFAIVILRSDIPAGQMGRCDGIRTAGHKLVTFQTPEAARAYLPRYAEWVRGGYSGDASWARYNRRVETEVFLVVRTADVDDHGVTVPDHAVARVPHSEIYK